MSVVLRLRIWNLHSAHVILQNPFRRILGTARVKKTNSNAKDDDDGIQEPWAFQEKLLEFQEIFCAGWFVTLCRHDGCVVLYFVLDVFATLSTKTHIELLASAISTFSMVSSSM